MIAAAPDATARAAGSALQGRNPFLKNSLRGIRQSAVNIPRLFQTETRRRMGAVLKHIRSCSIDRNRSRIGWQDPAAPDLACSCMVSNLNFLFFLSDILSFSYRFYMNYSFKNRPAGTVLKRPGPCILTQLLLLFHKKRCGIISVSAVREQSHNCPASEFRPFCQLNGSLQSRSGGNPDQHAFCLCQQLCHVKSILVFD